MNINKRIDDRINWCFSLYKEIVDRTADEEVARIIFRTIMFEENYRK